MSCGTPGRWRSMHLATRCPVAGGRSIEALSSMARQWFGRKERSDQDPDGAAATGELAIRTDTDPISDEAESEREEEPTEIRVEPETNDVPSPADRPAAPTRGALAGVGAAAIARLPAVRAAIRPRLPRLALAVGGGLLLFASFPPVNWWWAAVVAAAR